MSVTGWPRRIAWSEFSEISTRPEGEEENAQIDVRISPPGSGIQVVRDGRQVRIDDIEVPVSVEASDTWVVAGTKTDDLLSHEQGHYDISGLVATELYGKLLAARAATAAALAERLNALVRRAGRKADGLYKKYDRETDHGRLADKQKAWKERIRDAMAAGNRALPDP